MEQLTSGGVNGTMNQCTIQPQWVSKWNNGTTWVSEWNNGLVDE